ncbi:hypothetical protein [Mesorhizobium sp. J428]|nr:hypothetical protein [Mesorhizobium sp. J428]MCR5856944.1 hypothetical protein [Mesorhizobium sp. J428]
MSAAIGLGAHHSVRGRHPVLERQAAGRVPAPFMSKNRAAANVSRRRA